MLTHRLERPIIDPDPPAQLVSALRGENLFGFLHSDCWGGPEQCPLQQDETEYLDAGGLLTKAERTRLFGEPGRRRRR